MTRKIYVFNVRSGVTKIFDRARDVKNEYEFVNHSVVSNALKNGTVVHSRYYITYTRPSHAKKTELYTRYWDAQLDVNCEVWRPAIDGLEVSTLGRIRVIEPRKYLFPVRMGQMYVFWHQKKTYNLARMIAEEFIVKRPLKDDEVVIRKCLATDFNPGSLEVKCRASQIEYVNRLKGIEVAEVDSKGNVIEIYPSIRETARATGIDYGNLRCALLKDGLIQRRFFKFTNDLY